MLYNKLYRKIMTAWWIKRLIRFIVILVIIIILYKVISRQDFYKFIAPYFYLVVIFILTYQIITLILYPILEYRQWGYLISNDRVEIKHGIFYIVTTVIPIIRIQHVTIENGPILRKLGLSMVKLIQPAERLLSKDFPMRMLCPLQKLLKTNSIPDLNNRQRNR